MPRLSALPITLSASEQTDLEKLVRCPSTAQQLALRAKIILRAASGQGHGEISRELGITKDTSRLWRQRWLHLSDSELSVKERLADAVKGLVYLDVNLSGKQFDAPDSSNEGYEFAQARGIVTIDTTGSAFGNVGIVAIIPVGI